MFWSSWPPRCVRREIDACSYIGGARARASLWARVVLWCADAVAVSCSRNCICGYLNTTHPHLLRDALTTLLLLTPAYLQNNYCNFELRSTWLLCNLHLPNILTTISEFYGFKLTAMRMMKVYWLFSCKMNALSIIVLISILFFGNYIFDTAQRLIYHHASWRNMICITDNR